MSVTSLPHMVVHSFLLLMKRKLSSSTVDRLIKPHSMILKLVKLVAKS